MATAGRQQTIEDFLGSTRVFASALTDVLEAKLLRQVAGSRVTVPQLKLLKLVTLTDKHIIGDVASFLGVSPAGASKAVDKLVRRALLRRTEGTADRRATELSLTPSGLRLLGAYETAKKERLAQVFGRTAPEELNRAAGLLDRLTAAIVDHAAKPEEICLQCGIYFREKCLLRELVRRTCFYQSHKVRKEVKEGS